MVVGGLAAVALVDEAATPRVFHSGASHAAAGPRLPTEKQPLPPGWAQKVDEAGRPFYVDHVSVHDGWSHDRDVDHFLWLTSLRRSGEKMSRSVCEALIFQ